MKIRRIQLSNILSFSEEDPLDIELSDLNFIVGPNNSGKTNLLRALKLFFRIVKFKIEAKEKDITTWSQSKLDPVLRDYIDIKDIIRDNNLSYPFSMKITTELIEDWSVKNEFSDVENILKLIGKGLEHELINSNLNELFGQIYGKNHSEYKQFESFRKEVKNKYPSLRDNEAFNEYTLEYFRKFWSREIKRLIKLIFPRGECIFEISYEGKLDQIPKLQINLDKNLVFTEADAIIPKDEEEKRHYNEYTKEFLHYFISNMKSQKKKKLKIQTPIEKMFKKPGSIWLNKINFGNSNIYNDVLKNLRDNFLEYYRLDNNKDISNLFSLYYFLLLKLCELEPITDINKKIETTSLIEDFNDHFTLQRSVELDRDLPIELFTLKNSSNRSENNYYKIIQDEFFNITGYNFDVVIKYESIKDSKGKKPNKIQLYISEKNISSLKGKELNNAIFYSLDSVGSGLQEILYHVVIMTIRDFVFLDEPAQCIHPFWQKKMVKLIIEKSKNKQFLIITHSPYLLPDFSVNKNIDMYHFHYNNKKHITICNNIDFILFIKPKLRRIIKSINNKKDFFFANLNLLVEGDSDELILPRIIENLGWEKEYVIKNIQIIHAWGSQIKSIAELFNTWNLPVAVMVDFDNADLIHKLPKNIEKIILPSDIEGTLILGEILWPLKEILKEDYLLNKNVLKFNPSSIPNPNKCKSCNQKISTGHDLNKYILNNLKSIEKELRSIKNKKDFIDKVDLFINMGNNSKRINKILNEQYSFNKKIINSVLIKMNQYKLLISKRQKGKIQKTELAIEMINNDKIMTNFPIQFKNSLELILDNEY